MAFLISRCIGTGLVIAGFLAVSCFGQVSPLNEAEFRVCISQAGSGYGSHCELMKGLYVITHNDHNAPGGPFAVGRSGITVSGQWITSRADTTVRRGSSIVGPLMWFKENISNVNIREFLFDGNRRVLGVYLPSVDLDLAFSSRPSNVTVESEFYDARQDAVNFTTYGGVLEYSFIHHAAYSGGLVSTSGSGYEVRYNRIEDCGGSGITVFSSAGTIRNNSFARNHREFPWQTCGGPCPGGQIVLHPQAQSITVSDNHIDGANIQAGAAWISGLEVYGRGHQLLRNNIFGHSGPGIYITGGQNIRVAERGQDGWKVDNNNKRTISPTFSGIAISNHPSIPQYSGNITIESYASTNGHLYPIAIETNGVGTITGITVRNNCLAGNINSFIYTSGSVNLTQYGNTYAGCQ